MTSRILFSLIARGTVVLAEYSTVTGNAQFIAHRILEKIPSVDTRVSYAQERHMYHILVNDGIAFLCMAEEGFGRRIPYAFLEDIKNEFFATYGTAALNAVAYEYDTEFSRRMQEKMEYFSNNPNADAINRVRGGIADVKNVMIENIEKVLERGERFELLVDKTSQLGQEAFIFKKEARRLKQQMRWKNMKMTLIIIAVVVLIAIIIIIGACGIDFSC